MDMGGTIDRAKGSTASEGQSAKPSACHTESEGCKEDTRSTPGLRPSHGGQAQIPRVFQHSGTPTIAPASSSDYLDNPEDNITQCDALPRLPSRYEVNTRELDDCSQCSESSSTVSGGKRSQDPATNVNCTPATADQRYHKLLRSPDNSPKGNIKAKVQPTHNTPSSIKQQSSHGKLASRSIIKSKPRNAQRILDKAPSYANSTNETTKRYNESDTIDRALAEAEYEVSVLSKHQHSSPLGVPSSPALATEQAVPNTLNNAGIESGFSCHCGLLLSLFHSEGQRTLVQPRGKPSGSSSRQSEYHHSKDASETGGNGTSRKRKRLFGGGGNGELPNDEDDDEDESTQRTSDKSSAEYLKRALACPFYKNDPAYFANDLFHDGKFFICAARGFPNMARLKEHMYRKHSLPHTCSRCGDIFPKKSDLDNHLPVLNPEKITCEIRTLPPSKTKGLTPDMEGELKKRSKNGVTPTAGAMWIDMYKKLFPGEALPPSGPYLTDYHGPPCGSCSITEREEYIKYSEQELPGLVQEELDARGGVAPENRDLLISVMKLCLEKLPAMFQVREASGSRLASEDMSPESMSQSHETLGDMMSCSTPPGPDAFQSDSKIHNYGLKEPSLPPLAEPDDTSFVGLHQNYIWDWEGPFGIQNLV